MRFLADENVPMATIRRLRADEHDVESVRELMPGCVDELVLAHAVTENRILLTFDQDFGALVFHRSMSSPVGVLLFRFDPTSPEQAADLLTAALATGVLLEGWFTVIEEDRLRQRPLP